MCPFSQTMSYVIRAQLLYGKIGLTLNNYPAFTFLLYIYSFIDTARMVFRLLWIKSNNCCSCAIYSSYQLWSNGRYRSFSFSSFWVVHFWSAFHCLIRMWINLVYNIPNRKMNRQEKLGRRSVIREIELTEHYCQIYIFSLRKTITSVMCFKTIKQITPPWLGEPLQIKTSLAELP